MKIESFNQGKSKKHFNYYKFNEVYWVRYIETDNMDNSNILSSLSILYDL